MTAHTTMVTIDAIGARSIVIQRLHLTGRLDTESLVSAMRAAGHDHLLHYVGAAHRDPVAWQMCVAYLDDPMASEPVLKSRALKAAHGWGVSPEQIAAVRP